MVEKGWRKRAGVRSPLDLLASAISGAAESGCVRRRVGSDIGRVSTKVFIVKGWCCITSVGCRVTPCSPLALAKAAGPGRLPGERGVHF